MIVLGIILLIVFFPEILGAVFGAFSVVFSAIGALFSSIFGD
jgi:hypothetical protein